MTILEIDKIEGQVVLYDGTCLLCNKAIQFILEHEDSEQLKFMTLDAKSASALIENNYQSPFPDSIFFYNNGVLLKESRAAFAIVNYLKAPYSYLKLFSFLPTFFTDAIYRWIARNRYKWFGRTTKDCLVLSENQRQRILG